MAHSLWLFVCGVKVERARLTRRWAAIKEREEGDVAAACDILQELQIETFGSMRKKEKSDFLLEQFRLNLAKKDFIRAMIVRNKITLKVLRRVKCTEGAHPCTHSVEMHILFFCGGHLTADFNL